MESLNRVSSSVRRELHRTKSLIGYGKVSHKTELFFVEGKLPRSEDGEIQSDVPVTNQTRYCLENLNRTLDAKRLSMEAVLQVTVYLRDMSEYDAMNDTYRRFFPEEIPARSTVAVSELLGDADVQIDAVVVRR